jgi:hypothetical protein
MEVELGFKIVTKWANEGQMKMEMKFFCQKKKIDSRLHSPSLPQQDTVYTKSGFLSFYKLCMLPYPKSKIIHGLKKKNMVTACKILQTIMSHVGHNFIRFLF